MSEKQKPFTYVWKEALKATEKKIYVPQKYGNLMSDEKKQHRIFYEGREMKDLYEMYKSEKCSWGYYIEQLNIIAARYYTEQRLKLAALESENAKLREAAKFAVDIL